jgi:hypothetical protein
MRRLARWVRRLTPAARPARTRGNVSPFPPRVEALEGRLLPTAYTITTTNDLLNDTTPGEVTLRDVLTAVSTQAPSGNAAAGTAGNTVKFAIGAPGSVQTIALGGGNVVAALPALSRTVFLDGWSQGGAHYSGPPLVVLDGTAAGTNADGLSFIAGSDGSTVRGLVLESFDGNAIVLNGTRRNLIAGNYLGTDASGRLDKGNSSTGVYLHGGATANTVGGTAAGAANVLSANHIAGIALGDAGTSGNVILGNLIGTNAAGTDGLGNRNFGVFIAGESTRNTVGGTAARAGNVISGNGFGVFIHNPGTSANLIVGNLIGTARNGLPTLGNTQAGILLDDGASANTVGGTAAGAANLISGNNTGVEIDLPGTSKNVVLGNLIGLDRTGRTAPAYFTDGVRIAYGATGNTIGGTGPGAANVISGGAFDVELAYDGTSGNAVLGNLLGTDRTGKVALANFGFGVFINSGATDNTVGGASAGAGNVIAGGEIGVEIDENFGHGPTSGNVVRGNFIGTDRGRTLNLGNRGDGIVVGGASHTTILGNAIAFNLGYGVELLGSTATGVSILGNSIWANAVSGIELTADGPSRNEADPFAVPNNGQAPPVITSRTLTGVSGTLSSVANTTFRIELFGSPTRGQGKTFLGAVLVTTGADGGASFTARVAAPPPGDFVTATATNLTTGDTSEFSAPGSQILVLSNPLLPFSLTPRVVTLRAQLFADDLALFLGRVTFTVAGLPGRVTATTDDEGFLIATFTVPALAAPGRHTIVANFSGDDFTDPLAAAGILTVLFPPL